MTRRFAGLMVVTLGLLMPAAASAAGPATVAVRIEGSGGTLVPQTTLTTTTAPVVKDGNAAHSCTGTSATGALEQASGGDWTGPWFSGLGYSVDVIKGESHPFGGDPVYWGFFLNDALASAGLCDPSSELQAGDRVLFAPIPEDGSPVSVLALAGVPATAAPGTPFTVTVTAATSAYQPDFSIETARAPVAGATVSGGGATATTGADGSAQVTLGTHGPTTLRATHGGDIRSAAEPVCVTDGADGSCGTTAASTTVASTCVTTGDDGNCGTTDRRAPRAKILSIAEGQRFAKGKGPRLLSGVVTADPSGIGAVRLRLTRTNAGRCETFDGRRERFVALRRCGAGRGAWFSAGDREQWSFLLPARLGPGRYVLDVEVRDGKGNRDTLLQRTRTRVVFTVA
jgi:hypothetical protein